MKVIVSILMVVALVGSCYFADRKASKKAIQEEVPAQAIAQESIPEKAPTQEVAQDKADEPAQAIAKEAIPEKAQELIEEPVLAIAQESIPEKAPTQEVAQDKADEPAQAIVQESIQEEVPHQEIASQDGDPSLELNATEAIAQQFVQEELSPSEEIAACCDEVCEPVCCEKRWYFEVKPGYYYLTDKMMRQFFDKGGFTFRAETGYRFWKPFIVWVDGGYFQEKGHAIGSNLSVELKLASLTLGLKTIWHFNDYAALYVGAGPRLFMMMMHNHSPFVRGEDSSFGIGAGFNGGFWVFPIPAWRNVFLDLFADYSWKKLKIEEDEISSTDFDIDVSGLTVGVGLGIRF